MMEHAPRSCSCRRDVRCWVQRLWCWLRCLRHLRSCCMEQLAVLARRVHAPASCTVYGRARILAWIRACNPGRYSTRGGDGLAWILAWIHACNPGHGISVQRLL